MKFNLLILLFCYCTNWLTAQNIVPNASFEEVNICTEYIAPCAPCGWMAVAPEMIKMKYLCNGAALQGQHYVSLLQEGPVENPDSRVYIQTRLLCPLQKGQAYKIKVYMNTENYPLRIGLRFDTAFIFSESTGCLPQPVSVELKEEYEQKKLWHTKMPWYILEKTYVATNNATHLIIGNFKAPIRKNGFSGYSNAQLLIDSISITAVNEQLPLCADTAATRAALYAEHHRHSIPDDLTPGRAVVHTLNGSHEGCDTLILKDDLFNQDRTTISERYKQQINEALKHYKGDTGMRIKLVGHAWQAASEEYNKIISFDKAKAVATYLVYNEGYSFDDFQISGEGKSNPRYDTADGAGDNNRVEMILCHVAPPPVLVVKKPVLPPDTLVIPDILFKFNSSELNPALHAALDSLMKKIPSDGSVQLQVTGHTDNAGNDDYNYNLSLRRANAVAGYMQQYGVGNDIRQISGAGESQPVADNKTLEGRRKNRRVEIIIFHTTD
ncbi:OmpA family protein [Chitinophaga sancti]|uniref:OmpA family protein n=1 Tax=Chitinophaga sancti TaxID=1004 RepID=A0A1K1NEQ2_9BACT|nr:OmpA family protein [Chitinophaga sancti]WQD63281.1 OmpA family protein [Chitinophaga sancti]WQG91093.1 OmpA family protein [Chitinophaga sancti]SFW33745.1 OmpA family protein [Chitinophaga sancti]